MSCSKPLRDCEHQNVSRFAKDLGPDEIKALIIEAAESGASWRVEGGCRVLDVDLGKIIGLDPNNIATSSIRIVVEGSTNTVTTAYPITLKL